MPQFQIRHRPRIIALAVIIANLMFFSACLNDSSRRPAPRAIEGVLDLSDWDFKKEGPVDLDGEWEFYWQQHLMPQDFPLETAPRNPSFITVPGYWKGYRLAGKKLPGYGYTTYRLMVVLNGQEEPLALRTVEISNAYTIYVNGKALASLGKAGKNLETTVPRQHPQIVDFEIRKNQMELIVQVSNFHHRRGGIWEVIQLGREKDIRQAQERRLGFDLFLFGSIFLMGLYHLGLFIVRKKDRSPLYFSIFCFLVALRLLTTGERCLILMFPNIPWEIMIKFEYLSFYLAVPAFMLFMKSIFPGFSRRFLHLIQFLGIGFAGAVIFTPARFFTYTINIYEGITIMALLYGLYIIFTSLVHKNIEAFILLIGFLILSTTTINDMLHVERIIQTGFFAPLGLFVFILSQGFLLSYRFSTALTTVENQQIELRDTLESYKAEIVERVRAEDALRKSHERFLTVLDSIDADVYVSDIETYEILFINKHLRDTFGRDLIGQTCWRVFRNRSEPCRDCTNKKLLDDEGNPTGVYVWEGKNPITERWYINYDRAIKWVDDRLVRLKVATDVTELKRAEEQAKLHQQQLMQASKMVALGTLVSGVAHEINNPNNFIMLNSPILKEAWENAMPILERYYEENGDFIVGGMQFSEMREHMPTLFSGISDGARRIKRIVDDLKNYVRDDTADLNQSVDINAVITSAVALLSNMIKKSTNHFSIRYAKNMPQLSGNFQRLEQVMINLIQNACQALPDTQRSILVSVRFVEEKSTIVIKVRDEGTGIPPEKIPHITDPFFTTKQDFGGVGLGLSISSKIVEEHGGSLQFKSAMGRGTTAEITLPVDRENQTVKGRPK